MDIKNIIQPRMAQILVDLHNVSNDFAIELTRVEEEHQENFDNRLTEFSDAYKNMTGIIMRTMNEIMRLDLEKLCED